MIRKNRRVCGGMKPCQRSAVFVHNACRINIHQLPKNRGVWWKLAGRFDTSSNERSLYYAVETRFVKRPLPTHLGQPKSLIGELPLTTATSLYLAIRARYSRRWRESCLGPSSASGSHVYHRPQSSSVPRFTAGGRPCPIGWIKCQKLNVMTVTRAAHQARASTVRRAKRAGGEWRALSERIANRWHS